MPKKVPQIRKMTLEITSKVRSKEHLVNIWIYLKVTFSPLNLFKQYMTKKNCKKIVAYT